MKTYDPDWELLKYYPENFQQCLQEHNVEYESGLTIDNFTYDVLIPSSQTLIVFADCSRLMPKYYYRDKVMTAREHSMNCVCVWDWDDLDKIVNIVSKPLIKVYARDCTIFKLHESVGKEFIANYDISGNCRGQSLFLGLVYHGQLIQVMSFGKSRFNKHYYVELMRFCTKPRYQVLGGLSRLYNFAINYIDLYSIICYNDLSKFSGESLDNTNLVWERDNPPRMVWNKDGKFLPSSANFKYYRKHSEDFIKEGWKCCYDCGYSVYTDGQRRH